MRLRIALVAAVWVVGGCSAAGGGSGPLRPDSEQPSAVPAASADGSPGAIDLPASVIDPVVADIAKLAGVPVDQVTVLSAQSVTFPDGGLGCPLPGMVYPQVLVDGFKLVAEAGGTTYDYRGTGPGTFRRCTTG